MVNMKFNKLILFPLDPTPNKSFNTSTQKTIRPNQIFVVHDQTAIFRVTMKDLGLQINN